MIRSWAALVVFGGLLAMPLASARAQDGSVTAADDIGRASLSDPLSGTTGFGAWGGYLYFRKNFDNGIGYRNGFSNLGWFQPMQLSDDSTFFGQGQFFVTDNGQVGGNVGGGFRHYDPERNSLIGAYGFFDFDQSVHWNRYNQFSIGFEYRSTRFDFLANGYFPFSQSQQNFIAVQNLSNSLVFGGNSLLFNGNALFESAMPGADFEVGFPIFDPSALGRLRGYIGGYAFDSVNQNPAGVRARLESHLSQYATIGATFYHDNVNGSMATAAVELRGWNRRLPALRHSSANNRPKLYLPVTRQYRVAVEQFSSHYEAPVLAADGHALDFVWVNNGNAAPGSGTFEDPYHDMPAKAPGADYILVYQGPSSPDNPVLGGITLTDGQKLYGEGFNFFIDIAGTKFGPSPAVVSILDVEPAWDTHGNHPYVSNPTGDFVTLASNNDVGGFNIVSTLGNGVAGNGINNFHLFDMNIGDANPAYGNNGAGVFLTNASGVGIIENFTLMNNADGGIIIENTNTSLLALSINPNTTVDPNVVGGGPALFLLANNSDIVANSNVIAGTGINNFRSTDALSGLFLGAANGGTIDAAVNSSAFDNTTTGDGVDVLADSNGSINLSLVDTTADNSGQVGMYVQLTNDSQFTGTVTGASSISGAALDGVRMIVDGSSSMSNSLQFFNTAINNSGQDMVPGFNDGIHLELTGGSYFNVELHDVQIIGSGGDAIDDFEDGASTLDLLVDPSLLTNSGENGFLFNVINNSVLNATFLDSDLSGSGQAGVLGAGNGIHGILDTGGVANLALTRMNVTQSGEHGLFLEAMGGSTFNGTVDDSDLSDSNQSGGAFDGINVVVDGAGTTASLVMTDTTVDNTFAGGGMQMNALDFLVDNGGSFIFSATETGSFFSTHTSSFSNALSDGVFGRTHNGGTADITFDGTPIDNSGDNGFNLAADTGSILTASLLNGSSTSNNFNNGILANATNLGTVMNLNVISSTVDNNTFGSGLDLTVTDDAVLNTVLTDSSASSNGADGVRLLVDGGGTTTPTANLLVDGFHADGNAGNGWNTSVLGGGLLAADYTGFFSPSSASGNGLDGFFLLVDGAGSLATVNMADFTADFNGLLGAGNGFNIEAANDAVLDMTITGGVSGSDNQLNGFLLTADTGMNTIARVNMTDGNVFDNNGLAGDPVNGNGVFVNASGIAELEALVAGGSSNALDGVRIDATNVALITNVGVTGPSSSSMNGGNGVTINLTDDAQVQNVQVTDVQVNDNTGAGVVITANNSIMTDVFVSRNDMSGNAGGDGILFDFTDSSVTGTLTVSDSGASNNAANGINFELDNSTIADVVLSGNTQGQAFAAGTLDFSFNNLIWTTFMDNNAASTFDISQVDLDITAVGQEWRPDLTPFTNGNFQPTGMTDVTVGLDSVNGNLITAGTNPLQSLFGFVLPGGGVTPGDQLLSLGFTDFNPGETLDYSLAHTLLGDNTLQNGSSLAGSTITVTLPDGRTATGVLGPFGVNIVQAFGARSPGISSNGLDGIRIGATNGSDIGALTIDGNLIDANGQHGIDFQIDNSTIPDPGAPTVISNNTITNNTVDGVHLVQPITAGAADIGMNFVDNTITGNQTGVHVEIDDNTGQFVSDSSGNTIDNNTSFGFRLVSNQNSSFDVGFDGGSFSGNGDAGVGVSLNDNSSGVLTVENATISNNVNGPAANFDGQGIMVQVSDTADLLAGTAFNNNMVADNAAAGIEVFAHDQATVQGTVVDGNTLDNNTDAGILFERVDNAHISGVTISNNTITNGDDGIELIARNGNNTDTYTLTDNTIQGVGSRGVVLEQGFDAPQVVNMSGNLIDGSGGDGIVAFNTAGTLGTELRELVGVWQNNTITNNGGDGIELDGLMGRFLGSLVVTNNTISDNGAIGINQTGGGIADFTFNTVESNGGGGIYITGAGFKNIDVTNNQIRLNTGDGFRLVNNNNSGAVSFSINASNNTIEFNSQRGMNVLNQGTATTSLTMNGNTVRFNDREGVYVMNSSSTTQSANFGAALAADGAVNRIPRLNLTFNGNTVQGNGNVGTTVATGGFVLRVGTSDGGRNSTTDTGLFANSGRGGVIANVSSNTFVGNAGSDVYFDSFTSTVDPNTTGGTWTDMNNNPRDPTDDVFNPTGYQTDPLARLDLTFTNNTGDEQQMTNTGASYTNDEPVFKSRTRGQDGNDPAGPFPGAPDDDGPFGSGTRSRNAQRLAFRGALPPTFAAGANYLFPGMGTSTFRVNASGNSFSSPFGTGFIFDSAVYANPGTDANGVPGNFPNGGPLGLDNMPWGWSILP